MRISHFDRFARAVWIGVSIPALVVGCAPQRQMLTQTHEQNLASRQFESVERYSVRTAGGKWKPSRLPLQCLPYAPPIAIMKREAVAKLSGTVLAQIQTGGAVELVGVVASIPAGILLEVEAYWREAIVTAPCRLDPNVESARVEFPFTFELQD
mgnify:CR=1 FL=1